MKRILVLVSAAAALAGLPLATSAWAHPTDEPDDGLSVSGASQSSFEVEGTGAATVGAGTVSVQATDGSTVTCAVPEGVDLSAFAGKTVKVECKSEDGKLVLDEIKDPATGAKLEVGDDEDGDNSGPGKGEEDDSDDSSGPGSVSDDEDDDHHSGPGGGGGDEDDDD